MTALGAGKGPWLLAGALALAVASAGPRAAVAQDSAGVSTPPALHYLLPNGLSVLLQEDHRQRLVAVRMSYGIGARDDPKDRVGLAHLVEHMTYRGSRHLPDGEGAALLQRAGASDANGATSLDDTSYFATVSADALELELWLESERMGFTLEHFDNPHLRSEQRIVRQEEAMRSSSPLGHFRALLAAVYGPGHPYSAAVERGSLVEKLALGDVRDFFLSGYRPDNAQLVIIGDFETKAARALVQRYFGSLRNPEVPRARAQPPPRSDYHGGRHEVFRRGVLVDSVLMAWPVELGDLRDQARVDLLSRLAREELEERQLTEVRVTTTLKIGLEPLALGPLFVAQAQLAPNAVPSDVPPLITAEFASLTHGVNAAGLERARHRAVIEWLSGWQSLARRAEVQLRMLRLLGRPIDVNEYVRALMSVTPDELSALARAYDPRLVTTVDAINFARAPAPTPGGAR